MNFVIRDSKYEDDPSMRDGCKFSNRAMALNYVRDCEKRWGLPKGRYYVWDRELKERVTC